MRNYVPFETNEININSGGKQMHRGNGSFLCVVCIRIESMYFYKYNQCDKSCETQCNEQGYVHVRLPMYQH